MYLESKMARSSTSEYSGPSFESWAPVSVKRLEEQWGRVRQG
jgi:hypothetical protein